ncbi:MAG: DUF72 domain-containing protein [Thermodesulfobacteriota bacterium]
MPAQPAPIPRNISAGGRLYVGTSGYAYTEWVEAGFYPPGTSSNRMLPLYARRFPATELNYTWYQMPRSDTVERQRRQAPADFIFTAKLTRTLTHEIDPQNWPLQAAGYRNGIAPLRQGGQLGAVLVQLPPSFSRTPDRRAHLAALLDELADLPLAVEFRHHSWANDRVFAELERRRVTLVHVDIPPLPGLFTSPDVVTNPDLCYVRFHGRNARGWRSGNLQQQFDYSYSDEQLREWVQEKILPMAGRAKTILLFFNNHVRAQAVENARQLIGLLRQEGLTVA